MNPDLDALSVIRSAAEALVEHVAGYDQSAFEAERKVRSAVLYEIVVIGEGAKRLSPQFRERNPQIPWKQITGIRDRVVHSFDEVDLGMVWSVCQLHARSLIEALDRINVERSNP